VFLIQIVNAVGECEVEAARRVAFAVMFAQVACFGDEFSEWFDGWHHE
jgi:hypothetical protein